MPDPLNLRLEAAGVHTPFYLAEQCAGIIAEKARSVIHSTRAEGSAATNSRIMLPCAYERGFRRT